MQLPYRAYQDFPQQQQTLLHRNWLLLLLHDAKLSLLKKVILKTNGATRGNRENVHKNM